KTYDSQDSLVVTHRTTDWPVTSLDRAERTGRLRTGRLVLWYLWSYVLEVRERAVYILIAKAGLS
ncbi:hypothetical protein AOQ84DRAFT_281810, partial [Glonium stellatum]